MNDSPMIAGRGKKRFSKKVEPFLYLLPAAAFFAVFTFYPFIKTIYSSFFLVNAKGEIRNFVGMENYIHVLSDPKFIKSIGNTLLYVALSSPVAIIISLVLAMLCCKKTKTSSIYETMFAITMAMSLSVTAMIFNLLYNPTIGALNHLVGQKIRWLGDPKIAMISLSIIAVWMNIGYNFLFLLAAVRGVPAELLESAEVGATEIMTFLIVQVPLSMFSFWSVLPQSPAGLFPPLRCREKSHTAIREIYFLPHTATPGCPALPVLPPARA